MEISKQDLAYDLAALINDGVISLADIDEFSEGFSYSQPSSHFFYFPNFSINFQLPVTSLSSHFSFFSWPSPWHQGSIPGYSQILKD